MKPKPHFKSRRSQGFTLIELLVVITIIAILAGLVMSQANKIMDDTRRLQTQTVLKDLRLAIGNYQVDYNRFPVKPSLLSSASGGQDIQALQTDENSGLIDALMSSQQSSAAAGGSGGATNLNPRGIKYIDLPVARNRMYGLVNSAPPYRLVDLWGQTYWILLDTNGDKQVTNPDLNNTDPKISQNPISPPPQMLPTETAIYSWGKDKMPSTKDDVVSWRIK